MVEVDMCYFWAAQNSFILFLTASNINWESTFSPISMQVELISPPSPEGGM